MNPNTACISPTRQRVLKFLNSVVVLLIISLVLQVVGCFSPGWVYLTYTDGTDVHSGLWYMRVCINGVCKTRSTTVFQPSSQSEITGVMTNILNEYRGETISAFVLCFAAIVVLRLSRTRLYTPNSNTVMAPLVIGGVLVLLTGILATTAAGKCADQTREAADLIKSAGMDNPINFPYSLFMTGVGGLLGLIAFLLLLSSQPWKISAESQQALQQAPQPAMYPAQFATVQTAYPQGQPQMYAIAAAPATMEKSQGAPSYY